MSRGRTERVLARRLRAGGAIDEGRRPDELIVEEPLEIRLDDQLVATTMRTPGHDFELAVGFCFTDGLLGGAPVRDLPLLRHRLGGRHRVQRGQRRHRRPGARAAAPPGTTSSSCGLCGTDPARRAGRPRSKPLPDHEPWDPAVLLAVADAVREHQDLFARTGAVHAAGGVRPSTGAIDVVREDIGRHNAVDKVVGRLLLDDALPAADPGLFVSGRASFEIVQKAWAAGFEVVVAVSAPSALAVHTAEAAGLTLAGFVRGDAFNVYT